MHYAVYSVTAAAPSLSWGLYKISHTPTPRLRVAYHVVPRDYCTFDSCRLDACDVDYTQLQPRVEVRGIRSLGNALYLDRLIAGGIVGDTLPISNLCIEASRDCLGTQIDLLA